MTLVLRPATAADLPFLREMFVAAANWSSDRPAQDFDAIVEDEHMRRYIVDWGRAGDVAILAEESGEPIGAAWRRVYTAAEPGYGFLEPEIPEVSIGVRSGGRGRGIGAALLTALAEDARRSGLAALSLSVELENPALRLYLRQGYRLVRSGDEDHVLRLDLGERPDDTTLQ